MIKFTDWLDANPGMQQQLADALNTNKTCPSLVKHERRPIPRRWIPVVVKLSDGHFTAEELLDWSLSVSRRLSQMRQEQAAA